MAQKVTQLRRGVLELAILTLLGRGSRYGGEIVEALSGHEGLDAGPGTVYPLLSRLGNSGAVETYWKESPSGPPRKYYRLTRSGMDQLEKQSALWHSMVTSMNRLMTEGNS